MDSDLFMTETARYADIVLPACSSLERGELKAYQGGYLTFTKPVIAPLYDSKPDVDWLCELARYMDLGDEMLNSGYEACMDWIIDGCGLTVGRSEKIRSACKSPGRKARGSRILHPALQNAYRKVRILLQTN